jgi:tRNA (cytidine/uridine-2'-O-)-methyltransferase
LRIVLLTTKATQSYLDFQFSKNDVLLFGRESAGVPEHIHKATSARITIPMQGDVRSLSLVTSAAMVCGEAIRQVNNFKTDF